MSKEKMRFETGILTRRVRTMRARERFLSRVDHIVAPEVLLVVEFFAAYGARIVHAGVDGLNAGQLVEWEDAPRQGQG